jgi:hypothetical protein
MNGATTTRRRPRRSTRGNEWLSHLAAVLVAVAALVASTRLLALPSVVDRVTVENPTRYDVSVSVTDTERDGWMPVGIAPPRATTTFDQIVDHGDVWIFRFSAEGRGAEVQLTRRELEAVQWRVQVPAPLNS